MHPGDHLDSLDLDGVTRDRSQLVRIGAHHVGQHVRVGGVALRARHSKAFAVSGRLQRIDRVHRVPGGDQRPHPRTPVGLDPDLHQPRGVLDVVTELRTDHRVQPADPATPSCRRALASRRPAASITSTSWRSSAHSSPTNSNASPVCDTEHVQQPAGEPSAT
jgi:hypothetical protein